MEQSSADNLSLDLSVFAPEPSENARDPEGLSSKTDNSALMRCTNAVLRYAHRKSFGLLAVHGKGEWKSMEVESQDAAAVFSVRSMAEIANVSKETIRHIIGVLSIEPAAYGARNTRLYTEADCARIMEYLEGSTANLTAKPTANDRQDDRQALGGDRQIDRQPLQNDRQRPPNDCKAPPSDRQAPPSGEDSQTADYIEHLLAEIDRLEEDKAELSRQLDRAEQRVDVLLATVYKQAAQLPAPKKSFWKKMKDIFFEERKR